MNGQAYSDLYQINVSDSPTEWGSCQVIGRLLEQDWAISQVFRQENGASHSDLAGPGSP